VYYRRLMLAGVVVLLAFSSPAEADLVVPGDQTYTDLATFLANVQPGYYLETFDSFPAFGSVSTPHSFSGGAGNSFSYDATAASGLFSVAVPPPDGDVSLSTTNEADPIIFTFTSGNVTAVGGYFFPTDINGNIMAGTINVALDDGTNVNVVNGDLTTFLGFTTTGPIASLTLTDPSDPFVTVDDLYVGAGGAQGAAVPEPATLALAGLGLLSLVGYRCRRKR
jgi:hypothetical protein